MQRYKYLELSSRYSSSRKEIAISSLVQASSKFSLKMISKLSYAPLLLVLSAICAQGATLDPRNTSGDIACEGDLVPLCCTGSDVAQGLTVTGCQRCNNPHNVALSLSQPTNELCQTPLIPPLASLKAKCIVSFLHPSFLSICDYNDRTLGWARAYFSSGCQSLNVSSWRRTSKP